MAACGSARLALRACHSAARCSHPKPCAGSTGSAAPAWRTATLGGGSLLLRRAVLSVVLTPLLLALPGAAVDAPRVLDRSRALSASRAAALERQLSTLEQDTGYRVRLVVADGQLDPRGGGATGAELRALWGARDERTLYVLADPTQQSILSFAAGKDVQAQLYGQMLSELQGRFGNLFFLREEGVEEALAQTLAAIDGCLRRPGGCSAVPGVPEEGRWLTLSPSLFAGAVLGYALRQPGSRLTWAAITSPLWAFLLVSFGVAPVLTRTDDLQALLPNLGGFAIAAGLLFLTPILGASPATRPRDDDSA